MLGTTQGIVFHSVKYGDSGRILKIYTMDHGLLSFIAQGLNRKNNLKKAHFQHLNVLDIHFYQRRQNSLLRLKESRLQLDNSSLHIERIHLLLFTTEFLKNSIREEESNPPLYQHIKKWIEKLHLDEKIELLDLIKFCINTSNYLGFFPMNNNETYFNLVNGCFENNMADTSCMLSESSSSLFKKLLENDNNFSAAQEQENLKNVMRFFSIHLSHFKVPKSLDLVIVN